MIIRIEKRRQFTVVANEALRDERLSYRATGVLAYLLSLPPESEISGHRLQHAKTEGRDAVYRALKELETAGYLKRTRVQDKSGHWFWASTLVELASTGNQRPIPGFPNTDSQYSVNQDSIEVLEPEVLKTGGTENPLPHDDLRRRVRALRGLPTDAEIDELEAAGCDDRMIERIVDGAIERIVDGRIDG